MIYRIFAVFLAVLLLSSCASKKALKPLGNEVLPPAEELKLPDVGPKPDAVDKKVPVTEEEKKADEQFVMLNFENADLETVVNTMSEMLKINYIVATGVTGKITIQSHNKIPKSELFQTFQTILEINGFTAVKDGSFYRIVPIDTAKQQPVPIEMGKAYTQPKDSSFVTQEIPIKYIKANDFANIARNLMPRGTDIIVYEPSNMLIVTALPNGIAKLTKLIESVDVPATERDSVKTFVYNVENGEAKNLANILKSIYVTKKGSEATSPVKNLAPTPTTPSSTPQPARTAARPRPATPTTVQEGLAGEIEGDVIIEAYDEINAIIIKTTPRGYLTLLETIKKLDVQAKQVLIEVLIAEITLKDETEFGLEWLFKTSIHATNTDGTGYDVISGVPNKSITIDDTVTSGFNTALPTAAAFANIIDPKRYSLLIKAAATNSNTKVLASPHILALDNKEAKIEIGDEVPVATSMTQGTAGSSTTSTTTSQVQFKSVGTILTVTPHINEKKQVTLKISQEVSQIGETAVIGSESFTGFRTRKANTTAIVQDGHTLVIGGIISETIEKASGGIPFLSRLPVIGFLFGSKSNKVNRKELILMITPHVIGSYEEADTLTREYQDRVTDLKKTIEERKEQDKKRIKEANKEEKEKKEKKAKEEKEKKAKEEKEEKED